jgi:hypothetical protein
VEISQAAGRGTHSDFSQATRLATSLPDLETLCTTDAEGTYAELISTCDELEDNASAAAHEISARFFSHAKTQSLQVSS